MPKIGHCVHLMGSVCSSGIHKNFICPYNGGSNECCFFDEYTYEMDKDAKEKGYFSFTPSLTMDERDEMAKNSFEKKLRATSSPYDLALLANQTELYFFDQYLLSLGLIKDEYVKIYNLAYNNTKGVN